MGESTNRRFMDLEDKLNKIGVDLAAMNVISFFVFNEYMKTCGDAKDFMRRLKEHADASVDVAPEIIEGNPQAKDMLEALRGQLDLKIADLDNILSKYPKDI